MSKKSTLYIYKNQTNDMKTETALSVSSGCVVSLIMKLMTLELSYQIHASSSESCFHKLLLKSFSTNVSEPNLIDCMYLVSLAYVGANLPRLLSSSPESPSRILPEISRM